MTTDSNEAAAAPDDKSNPADVIIALVRELVLELSPHRADSLRVDLDSTLDRDLGLDSLARAELLLRLERAFKIHLPEAVLAEAATPHELLTAALKADGAHAIPSSTEILRPTLSVVEAFPTEAETLTEVLDWHVANHADRPHITLWDNAAAETTITYGSLARDARAVARGLLEKDFQPGERVAIMLPTGGDFFHAFFGILYAGGVPVPIYPPIRMSQIEDHLRRQAAILDNSQATFMITVREARTVAAFLRTLVGTLRRVETVDSLWSETGPEPTGAAGPQEIGLLQYTSGSTGDPNGVMLTHANLLANMRAFGRALKLDSSDVFVSWLPLYHDMGLIGGWFGSLYHAAHLVVMSPITFLTRPAQWLWAMHRHGATVSAGPNFSFELCLNRIDDRELEGIDLSKLRVLMNGAEPIAPDSLSRFAERFGKYGFQLEAIYPAYGLAENTVALCFPPVGRGPLIDRVARDPLRTRGQAVTAAADDENALAFVACGGPIAGHEIRVVDDHGRELGERHEGKLQFRGPSATQGFFRNPEKTAALFDGDWLNTGDLAYIVAGEVYLTGRSKDIIIRAGRNIHPHELEQAVGNIEGIRKGCVAVFGSADPHTGTERIIVLAETREKDQTRLAELRRRIEETATDLLETPPDDVILGPPQSVPKTSSGKIRRSAARVLYEKGSIGAGRRAVWMQLARMAVSGAFGQFRRTLSSFGDMVYSGYWWGVIATGGALVWGTLLILPGLDNRVAFLRGVCRVLLRLTGARLSVEGLEDFPEGGAIIVANHSSYLDGLALLAAMPENIFFVAKKELNDQFVARTLLRRVEALFVERFDTSSSVEDSHKALDRVKAGQKLVFFPEGTLTRMPGLLSFRMGAFSVAAEAGVGVLPVTIRGTRTIMRGGQWFARRGRLVVSIAPTLSPGGGDFTAAVKLRDATRAAILERCGEPDLAEERVHFSAEDGIKRITNPMS